MPVRSRKVSRRHRGWTEDHKEQLRSGCDWFRNAWGNPPAPESLPEMQSAWDEFGDELMTDAHDTLSRPWFWVKHLAPKRVRDDAEALGLPEALERAGLLTKKALGVAADDEQLTRGILNDCHEPAFRRSWGWWRFTSPQRRDYSIPEAIQLAELERHGGEVLTERERHLVDHRCDIDCYAKSLGHVIRLTQAELDHLGLPARYLDPCEKDDDNATAQE